MGTWALYLGAYAQAQDYYEQAAGIFHDIGARRFKAVTLGNLGLLAHYRGQNQVALERCTRSLQLAQEIGERAAESHALGYRAHALAEIGLLADAAKDYRRAVTLRQSLGHLNQAMESQAGLARVALAEGEAAQALCLAEQVLEHLGGASPTALPEENLSGMENPLRVYQTCYQALTAAGDPRARQVLETAYRLLQERAGRIRSPELRRSFLENVAAHRAIVEAAEEG